MVKTEVNNRISELLNAMSLEEKVGQMTQITHSVLLKEIILNEDGSPGDDFSFDPEKVRHFIGKYHIGTFLNGIAVTQEEWYDYSQTLQEINLELNRHGIPIIYGIDHMHGANYIDNSTIFPHNINLGATFNPELVKNAARITGIESADLGHHWIFAPVLDVGRDPRFPRFYETYSEDPLVCAIMGRMAIEGIQNNPDIAPYRQVACAKHFLGYSYPMSGWDRTPSDFSDQYLYEYFVPPFREAVKAGVKTFMINGGEINGIPVNASYRLLTELLREELGFSGVVVTDWEDVIRLHTVHKVAESPKEAVLMAINAGIDISMTPFTTDFTGYLVELVNEGKISEERLNESVGRILRLKMEMGLFENPFPRNDRFDRLNLPEHEEANLETARQSLVLLKNENILPLAPEKKETIIITGPNANIKRSLGGGWTLRWIPLTDDIFPENMLTVYDAVKAEFPHKTVKLVEKDELKMQVLESDLIIFVGGEEPYSEGSGNVYDYTIDSEQREWLEDALGLEKPLILIEIGGRPRMRNLPFDEINAFIWAGLPGFQGAKAIAELIGGAFNPSGKLPFSYPAHEGHFFTYDYKLMDLDHYRGFKGNHTLLVPLGHGLSYTHFEYHSMKLEKNCLRKEETLTATIQVTNKGKIDGYESVLWYVTDEYASITRPMKQLKHFEKKFIKAGETAKFSFTIQPEKDLSFPNHKGETVLEKGEFTLHVGDHSAKFRLE